jgi:hypothetical protein
MINTAINISPDDVVLKPVSGLRGKRHANIPKGDLYAIVWLQEKMNDNFCHPELELVVAYQTKIDHNYYDERKSLLTVKFQRNNAYKDNRPGARSSGFMCGNAPRNKWSISYGMKIVSESLWGYSVKGFMAAVGLLQRAMDNISYNNNPKLYMSLSRKGDDLLSLIAGLQRIGVTIVIRNGRLAKRNMMSEI